MTVRWLVIESAPLRQIHDERSRPHIDPTERAHEILQSIGNRRSAIGGEVPNLTAVLDNRAGEASRAFALSPPVGARAVLYVLVDGAPVARFAGVVDAIDLDDETATITVKS